MSWRGTSGNYKARWTGYKPDLRAGRDAARPGPRLVGIRPCQNTSETYGKCKLIGDGGHAPMCDCQNTSETYGKCKGPGVWCGASVKTGQQEYVQVSDDAAHMGGPVYTLDIIRVVAMG
jgi:hypothetical protein